MATTCYAMILRRSNVSNIPDYGNIIKALGNLTEYADEPTPGDIFSDYFLGITMILSFFASTLLNPLTFFFNYRQQVRLKTTRILFMLLAISDFLTNIYRPLQIGYRFLSSTEYPLIRDKTLSDVLESISFRLLMFSSLILTSFISICRFINVQFPFFNISTRGVIFSYITLMTAALSCYTWLVAGFPLPKNEGIFALYCQMATAYKYHSPLDQSVTFIIHNVFTSILGIMGVVSSILTVVCLMSKKGDTGSEESDKLLRKSSQAVLYMNLGNVVMIANHLVYTSKGSQIPLINVLGAFAMAIILSAFNPLVRICLSKEIQDFVLNFARNKLSNVHVSLSQQTTEQTELTA